LGTPSEIILLAAKEYWLEFGGGVFFRELRREYKRMARGRSRRGHQRVREDLLWMTECCGLLAGEGTGRG
jgi:hypothetical protein